MLLPLSSGESTSTDAEYFHFMLFYTSTSLQFREKYCTFQSSTLILHYRFYTQNILMKYKLPNVPVHEVVKKSALYYYTWDLKYILLLILLYFYGSVFSHILIPNTRGNNFLNLHMDSCTWSFYCERKRPIKNYNKKHLLQF